MQHKEKMLHRPKFRVYHSDSSSNLLLPYLDTPSVHLRNRGCGMCGAYLVPKFLAVLAHKVPVWRPGLHTALFHADPHCVALSLLPHDAPSGPVEGQEVQECSQAAVITVHSVRAGIQE